MVKSFFTPKEVANIIGISYRQIQYWDKTNFIKPSYRRRGKYRLFTFTDLIQLKVAKEMRDKGYSIQRLRRTASSLKDLLPRVTSPLKELTFLIEGERLMIFNGEVLMHPPPKKDQYLFRVADLRDTVNEMYQPLEEAAAATGTDGDRYHHMPNHYSPALAVMQDRVHLDGPSSYKKGGKSIDSSVGREIAKYRQQII